MAKKPSKAAMQKQLDEKPVETPRVATELATSEDGSPIVVSCGNRGLAMSLCHEPDNYLHHVIQLTKAAAGMHRAIEVAQRYGERANWFDSDLNAALAGAELVSNLAAEYAMLIPEGR